MTGTLDYKQQQNNLIIMKSPCRCMYRVTPNNYHQNVVIIYLQKYDPCWLGGLLSIVVEQEILGWEED